jgi:hypothetical protein
MKMVVCSIKDLGAQVFARPVFVSHSNQARRGFMDEVNRRPAGEQQNDLFTHPDDFELYELGTFDDNTGLFTPHSAPLLLEQAKHVKQA